MVGSGEDVVVHMTMRERLSQFNPMLGFIMFYMACCAFNYGYDVGSFGGVQAMESFAKVFGKYYEDTDTWALPSYLSSIMTATPFLGKAIGCASAGWIAEVWGRRMSVIVMCVVSIIGVVLQVSAKAIAQFTLGRIITYIMTGMAIVIIPIYQGETAPRALRGMFNSTIQLLIVIGQIVATLVAFGCNKIHSNVGWQVPIGLQLVAPVVILALLPILPESPRWLLAKDRREESVKNLRKIRSKASEEEIQLEIESLAWIHHHEEKGTWGEVFEKQNRLRTSIAVLAMFGQQITGQAFPSQYGVVFYKQQGFGDKAFLFNVANTLVSLGGVLITWLGVDGLGRRPALITGGTLMGSFLFILAGIGSISPQSSLNASERNMMVASLLLFSFSYNISWGTVPFVVTSETAAARVKEKTVLLACVLSVLTTFVVSFTIPYLIGDDYAGLGGQVGFIYGSFNYVMVALTFFFIPELKGRTLEEVDQMFESGVSMRKMKHVKTRTAQELYTEEVGTKQKVISQEEQVESI